MTMSTFIFIISAVLSAVHGGATADMSSIDPELVEADAGVKVITVRKDVGGQFRTVGEALRSIPQWSKRWWILSIGGGEYWKKITIDMSKPFVTFFGLPWDKPVIVFNRTAAEFGTKGSATVAVESDYFVAVNIVFKNLAPEPDGKRMGARAVAMRIFGYKAAFHGCKFLGFQDTLCDDRGRHFFYKCHILGTVHFIFGDGRSIYMETTIESVAKKGGVMTAEGREDLYDNGGYAFVRCNIIGSGNMLLGRAWRNYSTVVFAYSYMDSVVDPSSWSDFGHPSREHSTFQKVRGDDSSVVDKRNQLRKKIKANIVAAAASGKDLEETGSEDDGLMYPSDDFFSHGSSSDEADADDEWTDKSTTEQASSASNKATTSGMSSDDKHQAPAPALMRPPRPLVNSLKRPTYTHASRGASSNRNTSFGRVEISSSNTSTSRNDPPFPSRASSNSVIGPSSNLSSNSDAHKPRRKRRPKKKKQQA